MKPHERVIGALDVGTYREAMILTETFKNVGISTVKIGHELFVSEGPPVVHAIKQQYGMDVMLDLKFHDIPRTMRGATRAIEYLGASFFTVHASALEEGVREAVLHKKNSKVLGVTVLSSISEKDCKKKLHRVGRKTQVLLYADMLEQVGADGIVCAPTELVVFSLHEKFSKLLKVVPGTRLPGSDHHDHKNVMTPAEAIRAGADYLVVGREITRAKNPIDTAHRFFENIDSA